MDNRIIFLVLFQICILRDVYLQQTFPQWCIKNKTMEERFLLKERNNLSVPCYDLFKYIRKGWMYDVQAMKTTYGGKDGISEYFRAQGKSAMCKVFSPSKFQTTNRTKQVIGCCDDENENNCTLDDSEVGNCFQDFYCQVPLNRVGLGLQDGIHHQLPAYTKSSCCGLLRGNAWRSPSLSSNAVISNNKCQYCDGDEIFEKQLETRKERESYKEKQTCLALNGQFLINLVGDLKEVTTNCTYRMAEHKELGWWIDFRFFVCDGSFRCQPGFRFGFNEGDVIITVIGGIVFVNDAKITISKSFSFEGIQIERTGNFSMIRSEFGVVIKWNNGGVFILTLQHRNEASKIEGVCKDGESPSNSWIKKEISDPDKDVLLGKSSAFTKHCIIQSPSEAFCDSKLPFYEIHSDKCRFLLKSVAFDQCRRIIKVDPYYQACLQSICSKQRYQASVCDVLVSYFLTCTANEIKVLPWMKSANCSWNCPLTSVFVECTSKCQMTCQSQNQPVPTNCYDDCFPGCQCPQGTLLKKLQNYKNFPNNTFCVESSMCPCTHDNNEYKIGEKIKVKCNTCTCGHTGRWSCTTYECKGVCNVIGSVHLNTFDSSKLLLKNSKCPWNVLVRTKASCFVHAKISIKYSESLVNPTRIHMRSIRIEIGEDRIDLNEHQKVYLNGSDTKLPIRGKNFILAQASTHSYLFQALGLVLVWIPVYDFIEIQLTPIYAKQVMGLCGTFTWNPNDDFQTEEGDIEINPSYFLRYFQQNDFGDVCFEPTVERYSINRRKRETNHLVAELNPCLLNLRGNDQARHLCGVYRSVSLKVCHLHIDPSDYEQSCFYDVCSSPVVTSAAACRSIAAYVLHCLQFIDDKDKIIQLGEWRKDKRLNKECDIQCPKGTSFQECVKASNTSCSDVSRSFINLQLQSEKVSDYLKCFPGCVCDRRMAMLPTALIQNLEIEKTYNIKNLVDDERDMSCVTIDRCPCYKEGDLYKYGTEVKLGCQTCMCEAGLWKCSNAMCNATYRCPNNMVFSHNVTQCDHVTCKDSHFITGLKQRGECEEEFQYKGCKCPHGMLMQSDRCIFQDDCPCHHGGKLYQKNDFIDRSCNRCSCKGGRWECTDHSCNGECITYGDSHMITFDGAKYTFQGTCLYTLARAANGIFQVTFKNVPCGYSSTVCSKSLYITVGNNTVHLLRGKLTTINGGFVGKTSSKYGSPNAGEENFFHIHEAGVYVIASWPALGFSVTWDKKTRIILRVAPRFMGKVEGLCGNFDSKPANDFTTPHFSVESSAATFVDSWKVLSDCDTSVTSEVETKFAPCEFHHHRRAWSQSRCSIISNGHVFERCRTAVSHLVYYEWCVFDACRCDSGGDCECVCSAIAAFAQACADQHISTRWRSQDLCPMQCEYGMVYMECGPVCPKTCFNETSGSQCAVLPCVEGCFCPEDMVMHEEKCIKINECPCQLDGGIYVQGSVAITNCQNCTCSEGTWKCKGSPCHLTTTCEKNEFLCFDKQMCIPSLWKCDLETDCADGSDESKCDWSMDSCEHAGGYLCNNRFCISDPKRCDGKPDCKDGEDEVGCLSKSGNTDCEEFLCSGGRCLPDSQVCDRILDCGFGDLSDEENCNQNCSILKHFACNHSSCISRSHRCDGNSDCSDESDETNCLCSSFQFTCADGLCIDRSHICNKEPDCFYGEDELECEEDKHSIKVPMNISKLKSNCSEFNCANDSQACMSWSMVCDGQNDCQDGSDEDENCWKECNEDEVICDRGLSCVDVASLCNGEHECRDMKNNLSKICGENKSAENNCSGRFQCEDGSCINGSLVCDGKDDCELGDDEMGCIQTASNNTQVVPPQKFQESTFPSDCTNYSCLNGNCIPFEKICDGMNDCSDHSNQSLMMSSDEVACATWSSWSQWGACSTSCGSGMQVQVRACRNPNFKHESDDFETALRQRCRGDGHQSKSCFVSKCNNDSVTLTSWSPWSRCSVTCGSGTKSRWRYCTDGTHTCSAALYSGNMYSPQVLSEVTTCSLAPCKVNNCTDGKVYNNCKTQPHFRIKCPLTCREVGSEPSYSCTSLSNQQQPCLTGCFCPRGHVEIEYGSSKCVKIEDCPCFLNGKVYSRGDMARDSKTCQICQCASRGQWRGCLDDHTCSLSQACDWTEWSSWGPCFGPCGQHGVQWAFRTLLKPNRYGIKRRCRGSYRKTQRCPTSTCPTCLEVVKNITTSHRIGDEWKRGNCSVCICLENHRISCRKLCDLTSTDCHHNQTVVFDTKSKNCCRCKDLSFNSSDQIAAGDDSISPNDSLIQCDNGILCNSNNSYLCVGRISLCDGIVDCDGGEDENLELCLSHYMNGSCSYFPWSDWSKCSQSCGVGKQSRLRGLNSMLFENATCNGPFQEYKPCFLAACRSDGRWSPWQQWSRCSFTCGGGVRVRRRKCDSPRPQNGGEKCLGPCLETKTCNSAPCQSEFCPAGKVLVNRTMCNKFKLCDQTCADLSEDVECRTTCDVENGKGGCFCPEERFLQDGQCVLKNKCRCTNGHIEHMPGSRFLKNGCECKCVQGAILCSAKCGKVCVWSTWSQWSTCDKTCGNTAVMVRFRSSRVDHQEELIAASCPEIEEDSKPCQYVACVPTWSHWTAWTQCSSSCGFGSQAQKRICEIDGVAVNISFCLAFYSKTNHTRYRLCTNVRNNRKCSFCPPPMTYKCVAYPRACDVFVTKSLCLEKCVWTCACPDGLYSQDDQCVSIENCSCKDSTKFDSYQPPEIFSIGFKNEYLFEKCECLEGILKCTDSLKPQNRTLVRQWTTWTSWSNCDRSCFFLSGKTAETGKKKRFRQCLDSTMTQYIGNLARSKSSCVGLDEEVRYCELDLCPGSNLWSSWSQWSLCDRTCDIGIQSSSRKCQHPGLCYGPQLKARRCMLTSCKISSCPAGSFLQDICDPSDLNEPHCFFISPDNEKEEPSFEIKKKLKCKEEKFCRCNPGLFRQHDYCVSRERCNCFAFGKTRRSGSTFDVGSCTTCSCEGGKVLCKPRVDANGSFVCFLGQPCYDVDSDDITWTTWTSCTKSCGVGVRKRISHFVFDSGDHYIGSWCRRRAVQEEDCNFDPCSDLSGINQNFCELSNTIISSFWGMWSSWGVCSATPFTSSDGWRHRYRFCCIKSGDCIGSNTESSVCNVTNADSPTLDWSPWSRWSDCKPSVNSKIFSYQNRTRRCYGDRECAEKSFERKPCAVTHNLTDVETPPGDEECREQISGSVYYLCRPKTLKFCSGYKEWFRGCVPGCNCPGGMVLTTNGTACVNPEQCPCYDAENKVYYNHKETFIDIRCGALCKCDSGTIRCEGCGTNINKHQWSHWSACTKSCSVQYRHRVRTCTDMSNSKCFNTSNDLLLPGSYDGRSYQIQNKLCSTNPGCLFQEQKFSAWGQWRAWSKCDCNSTFSIRKRLCKNSLTALTRDRNPVLQECEGITFQTKICRIDASKCKHLCPNGLQLSSCSSPSCPRTCMDLSSSVECLDERMVSGSNTDRKRRWEKCNPQCTCPSGQLINPTNDKGVFECVEPRRCSCFVKNEAIYPELNNLIPLPFNESFSTSCQTCRCLDHGRVHRYTDNSCSRNGPAFNSSGWSKWTHWTKCSKTCGAKGTQWRVRSCTSDRVQSDCLGPNTEDRSCSMNASCTTTSWGVWSKCSKSCGFGGGIRFRTRECLEHNGCSNEVLKTIEKCNVGTACPPAFTKWSAWTSCSSSCSSGIRTRTRTCFNSIENLPLHFCANISDSNYNPVLQISNSTIESRLCYGKQCNNAKKVKSFWSMWTPWTSCSGHCGLGTQMRTRICLQQTGGSASTSGKACQGESSATKTCYLPLCPNNTSSSPCQRDLVLTDSCQQCRRHGDHRHGKRLPMTCRDLASGSYDDCDVSTKCSPLCSCESGKLLQINAETSGVCVRPFKCDCHDGKDIFWPSGAKWSYSEKRKESICWFTCSCLIGKIVCEKKCQEIKDFCQWGDWTQCDPSCYDDAYNSKQPTRYRLREIRNDSTGIGCSIEPRREVEICTDLPSCYGCYGDHYITKTWFPDNCTKCYCNSDRTPSCVNICFSQWTWWSECNTPCQNKLYRSRQRQCLRDKCGSDSSLLEFAHCNGTKAVLSLPCPSLKSTSNSNESRHDVAETSFGSQTDFKHDSKESASLNSCKIHTEKRVFSLDGCWSRDQEVVYCKGNCESSVRIRPMSPSPFISCSCCSYQVDPNYPVQDISLFCPNQTIQTLSIPNISKCFCSSAVCSGQNTTVLDLS